MATALRRIATVHTRSLACGVAPRVAVPRRAHVCYSTPSAVQVLQHEQQQVQQQQQQWPAQQPLSTDDKVAILDLCSRFDHVINNGMQQTLGDLITADAEVHHPKGVARGSREVVEFFLKCAPLARGNRHLTLNTIFHDGPVNGNAGNGALGPRKAHATSYRLLHRATNPPMLLASGICEDEFAWCDEERRWRFSRRELNMDPPAVAGDAQQRALQQQ